MIWAIMIAFIGLGIAGLYWVGQRSFGRRNAAGVEEFEDYSSMLALRFIEKVVKLSSAAMLFVGVITLLALWISGHEAAPRKTAEAPTKAPATSSSPAKRASKR
jgi:heme/copper-type cytochrome/quinol oxidase subunit 1